MPNITSILTCILLGAGYFGIMTDLDWTWQVRIGEQIWNNNCLRNADAFSYTIHGVLVHDFEWLYEVILYLVYSTLGIGGLKLLKMILIATPLVLLGWRLSAGGVRWRGQFFAFLTAVLIISGGWNLRPLVCTTIGLLLVSGWLHDHCVGRKPLTWWLPLTMLLWSNLHPGVITGQGLLAGAIGWEWINQWLKINRLLERSALWRLTLLGGLGLALTFVSPDPIDRLLYPFQPELKHPVQNLFVEMQPLYRMFTRLPVPTILAFALGAVTLIVVIKRYRIIRWWEIALLGGLTLLANVAVRVLPDWTLIMLAIGVPHLAAWLAEASDKRHTNRWVNGLLHVDLFAKRLLENPLFRWQPKVALTFACMLAAISFIPPLGNAVPVQSSPEWPVAALDRMEKLGIQGKFFGTPDHGSYIGWRLRDKALIYTDTRGFFFPPYRLEDSLYIPQQGPEWRERLDRVLADGTDYLMLDVTGPRGTLWASLKPHIGSPIVLDEQVVVISADQARAGLRGIDQRMAASNP